jgi:hypothetical protein
MKKILSVLLVFAILLGSFSVTAGAKADAVSKISIKTARNIATFHLATLEPVSIEGLNDTVKLGKDFILLKGRPLYNIKNVASFYSFNFESTTDKEIKGYITVSLNNDLPFVMEQGFGASPFDGEKIAKTYYIGPLSYYNQLTDSTYLDQNGNAIAFEEVEKNFRAYNAYRAEQPVKNSQLTAEVKAENAAVLSAVNMAKSAGNSVPAFQKIYDYILDLLYYYIGRVFHNVDIEQINASVEELIKENAGEGCTVTESRVVDKTYMIPRRQSYYELHAGSGICGKASSVMALAFYRDSMGYTALPDDAAIYAELSAIYDAMTEYFGFFFNDPTVNDMGLSESYEMLGTLDMGLAYYLYSKGYEAAAQNVIDNLCFSITLVPQGISNSLMKVLRLLLNVWLHEQTGGQLTLRTGTSRNPNDVIINTLKKGEPVVIGCLAAIGSDWFSNHYFAGVGYYKTECPVKINDTNVTTISKEYVEVYDTWGSHSSVMNWSVFKCTALYSATSMAAV